MKRKHKQFSKPRKMYDSVRIGDENKIVAKYGLKNKREIWKAKAKLEIIRNIAKKVIYSDEETKSKLINKLKQQGFNISDPVEILALTEEDILKRRLQTILVTKKLATTAKGARQMIIHKKVFVDNRIVSIPSYMVQTNEESKIKILKQEKNKLEKELKLGEEQNE
ncbi:MAG TPA: 30S ribosomal protein S4 [Candidatus Paceibacterota bacterium]|nr:30S ribosomal protein S4 [Candidatus Paceibacterota bacterium]